MYGRLDMWWVKGQLECVKGAPVGAWPGDVDRLGSHKLHIKLSYWTGIWKITSGKVSIKIQQIKKKCIEKLKLCNLTIKIIKCSLAFFISYHLGPYQKWLHGGKALQNFSIMTIEAFTNTTMWMNNKTCRKYYL